MQTRLIRDDGAAYSIAQLKADNPRRSFRNPPTAQSLEGTRGRLATVEPRPTPGPGQKVEALPAEQVNGEWVIRSIVRDKTESELLAEIPWQNATEARKAVVQWINGLTAQIEELYPSAVQKRWEIEEAAARAVKAGTADADQLALVTREGAAKGRTPEEHADAIIANAIRFRAIADQTNTLFLATDAQLQAAQSPLEYPAIFEWAKQQAAPLAAEYGLQV